MSERVLITGGTGFVGSHLYRHLSEQHLELHLTSMGGGSTDYKQAQVHKVDLRDSAATARLVEVVKPTQIYHLASLAAVGSSYEQAERVLIDNVQLQHSLLSAVLHHAPQARILHVSSAEVYGYSEENDKTLNEEAPLKPINPYGVSKATQDLLCYAYCKSYQMKIIRVRPFNHIGAGQTAQFALPAFAQQLVAIERGANPVLKVGNLQAVRDFTDVDDIVRAYILLMQRGVASEVYNLGSGTGIQMQTVVEQLCALAKVPVRIEVDPKRLRPLDIPVMVANNAKVKNLGWQPKVPLHASLESIIEYWRNQP